MCTSFCLFNASRYLKEHCFVWRFLGFIRLASGKKILRRKLVWNFGGIFISKESRSSRIRTFLLPLLPSATLHGIDRDVSLEMVMRSWRVTDKAALTMRFVRVCMNVPVRQRGRGRERERERESVCVCVCVRARLCVSVCLRQ